MRIIIDLQKAQMEIGFLGKPGPHLFFADDIIRNCGNHEIILSLSSFFPDSIELIRTFFQECLPKENIRVWYAQGPVRESQPDNIWRRKCAELIQEAFLSSLSPDVVVIPSLFEGYDNDIVTSIRVFNTYLKTVVFVDEHLVNQSLEINSNEQIHFLRKIEYLKRSDLVVVNQTSVRDSLYKISDLFNIQVINGFVINDVEGKSDQIAKNVNIFLIELKKVVTASAPLSNLTLMERKKLKLAYISPLPPERSGIADYSAELLTELGCFYDVDVIVNQSEITTPWIIANCKIRNVEWFLENSINYDRVLYHFGNSHFHHHMFDLLIKVPGVVVLHDFYLGDAQYYREAHTKSNHAWTKALFASHGYSAITKRFLLKNDADVVRDYPASVEVLQHAHGVIVHSDYSRRLGQQWYGESFVKEWAVIPLLRASVAHKLSREDTKKQLGFSDDDFLVCSFGFLGPNKLNHRLLDSWLTSSVGQDARCVLVFVGESHPGNYSSQLLEKIQSRSDIRVLITGWVDTQTYKNYLAAADLVVQLRTSSRGETSAAVLDCMNHGLPTIINAHGSMANLPEDVVKMVNDDFLDEELVEAIEVMWKNDENRIMLGARAQAYISSYHSPRDCAKQYFDAIENFYLFTSVLPHFLLNTLSQLDEYHLSNEDCLRLAELICFTFPLKSNRKLLIDVSEICQNDLKTGIQRVVRALVSELIKEPPYGYIVEPVYLTDAGNKWHYRYARHWTLNELGLPINWIEDEPMDINPEDILLVADFTPGRLVEGERAGLYNQLKNQGVEIHAIIYDLLPIIMPNAFPLNSNDRHQSWLDTIKRVANRLHCISQAVAEELKHMLQSGESEYSSLLNIDSFHLGADLESTLSTRGMSKEVDEILGGLKTMPSFLMVGTIEPRKGYAHTLAAFDLLWNEGIDISLVIIGKQGWMVDQLIQKLGAHPELGKRLFWLKGISDESLKKIYATSTCLIAASEGEGFGLPLIEAAQHKLPIIARDIAVFREVAGGHAYYFSGKNPKDLAETIQVWLSLYASGKHPMSDNMPWLTWKQSATQLLQNLIPSNISQEKNN